LNSSYEVSFYDSISKNFKKKTVQIKKGTTYSDICRDYWSSDAVKIVKQKEQLDSKALKHYNLKND
jgi:hypothetical protein